MYPTPTPPDESRSARRVVARGVGYVSTEIPPRRESDIASTHMEGGDNMTTLRRLVAPKAPRISGLAGHPASPSQIGKLLRAADAHADHLPGRGSKARFPAKGFRVVQSRTWDEPGLGNRYVLFIAVGNPTDEQYAAARSICEARGLVVGEYPDFGNLFAGLAEDLEFADDDAAD